MVQNRMPCYQAPSHHSHEIQASRTCDVPRGCGVYHPSGHKYPPGDVSSASNDHHQVGVMSDKIRQPQLQSITYTRLLQAPCASENSRFCPLNALFVVSIRNLPENLSIRSGRQPPACVLVVQPTKRDGQHPDDLRKNSVHQCDDDTCPPALTGDVKEESER